MIIKPYGGLPRMYAPDVGEVVLARRSASDKFVRAVVLGAHRNRAGHLRVKLHWLESDPNAGRTDYRRLKPLVAGTTHAVVLVPDMPPLIRQINRGTAPGV